ncbi:unnamed protein product [Rangifer tarandus platyrhynchus]|uniref:Uncharacterized protein n=2 Tax=Rangifer tarandus platyrhynchus TaxID=3082113 RepID=A0ABN8XXP3_RANTA|nr:unnamed protein product [Rangifer tarandus platyrhynchus]
MGREEILKAQIAIFCQRPRKPMPGGIASTARGASRILELEAHRPKKGRNASNDQGPPITVPWLSTQDPPNGGHVVTLTLQPQKLEQRPEKPKKQQESRSFQNNPEKSIY